MYDNETSTENFENDLKLILVCYWSVTWKMVFNPDVSKPAEEVLYINRNSNIYNHNASAITPVEDHKHLGLTLENTVSFDKHTDEKISKATRELE